MPSKLFDVHRLPVIWETKGKLRLFTVFRGRFVYVPSPILEATQAKWEGSVVHLIHDIN